MDSKPFKTSISRLVNKRFTLHYKKYRSKKYKKFWTVAE